MAARSVDITFINSLNLELRLKSESLAHGCYGTRPPNVIQPGQDAHWESETCGFLTGTEGSAVYEFTHDYQAFEINLNWDNPYAGSNSYSCSVNNKDYQISYTGGGGYNASVNFSFSKKNITTLWYTKTDDIWHNSYPTKSQDASSPGYLVPYKDKLFCFYQSEIPLDGNENDVFYMTKDDQSLSWGEPKPIKGLGDSNSGLFATLYYDKVLIACRSNDNKVKLISYKDGIFSDVIYYDIRSSYDLSLTIFNNEINLFSRGAAEDGIWHLLLEEKDNSYKNLGKITYWAYNGSFSEVIHTSISPKAIVYQGLIHLIYRAPDKLGWYCIKFDGERWSYPIHFTKTNYSHAPGLVVHNGLLKVAFVGSIDNRTDRLSDRVIYQYCYDGNSWSLPMPSSDLLAGYGVNMASYKGELFAVYPGIGASGITDDTVSPHDEL